MLLMESCVSLDVARSEMLTPRALGTELDIFSPHHSTLVPLRQGSLQYHRQFSRNTTETYGGKSCQSLEGHTIENQLQSLTILDVKTEFLICTKSRLGKKAHAVLSCITNS